jgi:hypothetical protein
MDSPRHERPAARRVMGQLAICVASIPLLSVAIPAKSSAQSPGANLPASSRPPIEAPVQGWPSHNRDRSSESEFSCDTGDVLRIRLGARSADVIAGISIGNDHFVLPLQPWDGGAARVVWSDGQHTLTWSAGVTLMWVSGSQHLMCGRSHKH